MNQGEFKFKFKISNYLRKDSGLTKKDFERIKRFLELKSNLILSMLIPDNGFYAGNVEGLGKEIFIKKISSAVDRNFVEDEGDYIINIVVFNDLSIADERLAWEKETGLVWAGRNYHDCDDGNIIDADFVEVKPSKQNKANKSRGIFGRRSKK